MNPSPSRPPQFPPDSSCGVFALNKARGETSAKAAAAARKLLGAKKAGHGGALDPLADGLLVVLLGGATPLARFALGGAKTYRAVVRFGFATTTDDAEGEPTTPEKKPDLSNLAQILPAFVGEFPQDAPRHSALKHQGRPLYYYARRGMDAPVKRRMARVFSLKLLRAENDIAALEIKCAAGFYVRSLARDLGERMQCGAHLAALTRTESCGLKLQDAASLAQLREASPDERAKMILPPEAAVLHLPRVVLPLSQITALANGLSVSASALSKEVPEGGEAALFSPEGRFAGAARVEGDELRPLTLPPWTREFQNKKAAGTTPARKEHHNNDERTTIRPALA